MYSSRKITACTTILWLLVWLTGLCPCPLNAQTPRVAIVLTQHEAYRVTAAASEKALKEKGRDVLIVELPKNASDILAAKQSQPPGSGADDAEFSASIKRITDAKPSAIITVGETATLLAIDSVKDIPVIYSMITNGLDFSLNSKDDPRSSRVAGVTTDILPKDQITWIQQVQPQAKNIAVLCSPQTRRTTESIAKAGKDAGVTITVVETTKDDFLQAVEDLKNKGCDGALMIADAQIYNVTTVKHLLLWGIRQKKSVWAFSENFVKAGALAGLYTDYESVGRQTAELADKVAGGTKVSSLGMQYPSQIRRAINERTATMIGLSISRQALDSATVRFGKE